MSNALESNQRTARKQEDFVKCRYVVMPEFEQEKKSANRADDVLRSPRDFELEKIKLIDDIDRSNNSNERGEEKLTV